MNDTTSTGTIPPTIARVLSRFRAMSREEKMQALVHYSKKLESLPERLQSIDRGSFSVPECQTRVDIFPEFRDGTMHFYADLNVRQSPTIAAFLAITFAAVNDQPPEVTTAIPSDYVQQLMEGIGLSGRETGLNAMIVRMKRYAQQAGHAEQGDVSDAG